MSLEKEHCELPAALKKCLSLWYCAKTDSERLTVLLLVTKVVRNEEVCAAARRQIFDTVGFTFINRLLASESEDEEQSYHQVAIAILSCYCTDAELCLHPQITSKVPMLMEVILKLSSSAISNSLVIDCLHCIRSLANSEKGRQYLWSYNTLDSLFQSWTMQKDNSRNITKEVILTLLSDVQLIASHPTYFTTTIEHLSTKFKDCQDELKFEICHLLAEVLVVVGEDRKIEEGVWLSNIAVGLQDILQSKLDATHRNTALSLAGVMCQKYGTQWTLLSLPEKGKTRFLLLLVHIVCVEVHLILHGQHFQSVIPHSSLLSSCFSVMEHTVVLLAQSTEDPSCRMLSEEDQLQIHTTLMEGFSVVAQFLASSSEHRVEDEILEEGKELTIKEIESKNALIFAAVRVLGAWMAEDSLALSSEVYSLLPFLVKLCKEEEDLLNFLLPGFSHLLAETKPRHILLSLGLVKLLIKHFKRLEMIVQKAKMKVLNSVKEQLCLLCSIGITLCVCEPNQLEVEVEESFSQWAALLPSLFSYHNQEATASASSLSSSSSLDLHSSALYMLLFRRRHDQMQTSTAVFQMILHSVTVWLTQWYHSGKVELCSNEVELWHIIVNELTAVANSSSDVCKALKESPDINEINQLLGKQGKSVKDDEQDIVITLSALLYSMNCGSQRT